MFDTLQFRKIFHSSFLAHSAPSFTPNRIQFGLISEIGTPEIGIPVNECRHAMLNFLAEHQEIKGRQSSLAIIQFKVIKIV